MLNRYVNGLKRIALEMFISVFVTFASTTIKIYLEFSENELFEKMKGFVAIVSIIGIDISTRLVLSLEVGHCLSHLLVLERQLTVRK